MKFGLSARRHSALAGEAHRKAKQSRPAKARIAPIFILAPEIDFCDPYPGAFLLPSMFADLEAGSRPGHAGNSANPLNGRLQMPRSRIVWAVCHHGRVGPNP